MCCTLEHEAGRKVCIFTRYDFIGVLKILIDVAWEGLKSQGNQRLLLAFMCNTCVDV